MATEETARELADPSIHALELRKILSTPERLAALDRLVSAEIEAQGIRQVQEQQERDRQALLHDTIELARIDEYLPRLDSAVRAQILTEGLLTIKVVDDVEFVSKTALTELSRDWLGDTGKRLQIQSRAIARQGREDGESRRRDLQTLQAASDPLESSDRLAELGGA